MKLKGSVPDGDMPGVEVRLIESKCHPSRCFLLSRVGLHRVSLERFTGRSSLVLGW